MPQGVVISPATNADGLFALFDRALSSGTTATKMNSESSRSHLVVSILIDATDRMTNSTITGKLTLVDLAGSERVKKSGATAQALKEAQSINKSLSALGNVVAAINSKQKHIPYRSNILTQLMSDSLGGNAKVQMFVNLSPADYNSGESDMSCVVSS